MKRGLLVVVATLFTLLFIAAAIFKDVPPFSTLLTEGVLTNIASVGKLLALGYGAVSAIRSASSYEKESSMRSAWQLMGAWFALYFLGQLVLTIFEVIRGKAPVPSLGDVFFFIGYLAGVVGTMRIILSYRSSGYAMGRTRGHVLMGLSAAILFVWVAVSYLGPVAHGPTPLAERIVNVGYPILDFVLLVPTLVLLRMTFAFRGGRLWTVWATFLAGVLFSAVGDVLFAIPGPIALVLGPLVHLCYVLGYGFAAVGASLHYELVRE